MKKRVAELVGAELDYAVAVAIGHVAEIGKYTESDSPVCRIKDWNKAGTLVNGSRFEPSIDWAHGGTIIERERISVECVAGYWFAGYFDQVGCSEGPTPLIAAMRAFVASRFGEEIEMPSPPTNEEPGRG